MRNKTLYRYTRNDKGVTVSPIEPKVSYETLYRVIADEGMVLVRNGETCGRVVDTASPEEWSEVCAETNEPITARVEDRI